ncbi:MAG: T9SS type A sorting domain-containing protein [Candidatus Sabulitectum sp.]|nr:T9SS type A sorting domain-containing protein [Candidatus Sabulitectum sp.]
MSYKTIFYLVALVIFLPNAHGFSFYDDFEDNDISDWEPRCVPGNWSVSEGMVHGNTGSSPTFLTPINATFFENGEITISAGGVHVFGISARLDDVDSGIYAYVSPDADVARIRLVENGVQSTIFNSIYADFPSGVTYELTLTCNDQNVSLAIVVPSTGDSWILNATDPNPHAGTFGFHMGDESNAFWDWIEVNNYETGNSAITWLITDDQSQGDGNFALEPGETIDLGIQLTNSGDGPLQNAFGILQSLNSDLVVINNYVTYGTIDPGESQYGSTDFTVLAPSNTPEGEAYEMRLTLMADGGYHEQLLFSLPVGSGLECDVESGAEDWTWEAITAGWSNDWHVSSEMNYSTGGQYSFKCGHSGSGDYSSHHFGGLLSPYMNLPLGGQINFWMWIDAQTQSSSLALDGGIVQYQRCGNWIDLSPVYTHQIASSSTGPFEDATEVFSGTSPWTQYSIALPDSLAGPGQIRFVFGSDDYGTREGWYIDEIFMGIPTSTEDPGESEVFSGPQLSLSVNPFSSSLAFTYLLPGVENSSLEIFDVTGRLVSSIDISSGDSAQTVTWNGTNSAGTVIPAGVYIAKICGHDQTTIRLIKI